MSGTPGDFTVYTSSTIVFPFWETTALHMSMMGQHNTHPPYAAYPATNSISRFLGL